MRLTDKTALITGGNSGNSGIGLATARLMLAEGGRVAITGRDRAKLDAAAAELGNDVVAIQADLDDPGSLSAMVATVADAFGTLDILFANAGVSGPSPLGGTTREAFEAILRTNLTGELATGYPRQHRRTRRHHHPDLNPRRPGPACRLRRRPSVSPEASPWTG